MRSLRSDESRLDSNGTELTERVAQAVHQGKVIAPGDNHAATEV
jgi:hypothetical protein